jgi:NADH-quinone oxidoreductase subunit F
MGTEKSKGYTIYSLSGHVKRPGQYEAPLGITLRELLDLGGGMRSNPDGTDAELKFWTPGGSSTPILTAEHLDVPLDYEGVAAAGSMLGTKALQVFDQTTSVVRCVLRWTEFYKHESCGKCTPCREGTWWMTQILQRLDAGKG